MNRHTMFLGKKKKQKNKTNSLWEVKCPKINLHILCNPSDIFTQGEMTGSGSGVGERARAQMTLLECKRRILKFTWVINAWASLDIFVREEDHSKMGTCFYHISPYVIKLQ